MARVTPARGSDSCSPSVVPRATATAAIVTADILFASCFRGVVFFGGGAVRGGDNELPSAETRRERKGEDYFLTGASENSSVRKHTAFYGK